MIHTKITLPNIQKTITYIDRKGGDGQTLVTWTTKAVSAPMVSVLRSGSVPVFSGDLLRSMTTREVLFKNVGRIWINFSAPYANIVEQGWNHSYGPRQAKMLRWWEFPNQRGAPIFRHRSGSYEGAHYALGATVFGQLIAPEMCYDAVQRWLSMG